MYKAFNIELKGDEYIIPYKMVDSIRVSEEDTILHIVTVNNVLEFKGMNPETVRELLDGYEDWLQM